MAYKRHKNGKEMSENHIRPWRNIYRRKSRQINVGNVTVGGDAPIAVQTMTNTLTTDIKSTIEKVVAASEAGADLVRVSIPDLEKILEKLSTSELEKMSTPETETLLRPDRQKVSTPELEELSTPELEKSSTPECHKKPTPVSEVFVEEEDDKIKFNIKQKHQNQHVK